MAKTIVKSAHTQTKSVSCVWGLLCRLASIDQQTNNVSVFEVIDEITLPKDLFENKEVKLLPIQHEIVTTWRKSISEALDTVDTNVELDIAIVDNSGKDIQHWITTMIFQAGRRRLRNRIQSPVFSITSPGDYSYRIKYRLSPEDEFELAYEIPFEVKSTENQ